MCSGKTRGSMRAKYETLSMSQHLISTRFEGEKRVKLCQLLARSNENKTFVLP